MRDVLEIPSRRIRSSIKSLALEALDFRNILERYELRPDKTKTVLSILNRELWNSQIFLSVETEWLAQRYGMQLKQTGKRPARSKAPKFSRGLECAETVANHIIEIMAEYRSRKRRHPRILEVMEWELHSAMCDLVICANQCKPWRYGKMYKYFLMSLPTGSYIVSCSESMDMDNPGPAFEGRVPEGEDREVLWEEIKESGTDQNGYEVYLSEEDYYG